MNANVILMKKKLIDSKFFEFRRLLEDKQGDVNDLDDSGYNILLYYAMKAKEIKIEMIDFINLLLEFKINLDYQNPLFKSYSALHIAVLHDNFELTKTLIDKGINIELKDENGNTALWRQGLRV